jgi:hypothetical protein
MQPATQSDNQRSKKPMEFAEVIVVAGVRVIGYALSFNNVDERVCREGIDNFLIS